jgi:methionine synthase I (cobalamin-dependent)
MHPLIEDLLSRGPVITDGAWGTQLQARGLSPGDLPDLWNLTQPEKVAEVAKAYVEAGSRVILTNTFGANRFRLAEGGAEAQLEAINRSGVEISRRVAAGKAFVFASIGPSGKLLADGSVSRDELSAAFKEQAQALAVAGADALVIETMSDLDEAIIAVNAAQTTDLPVIASMVFDSGKNLDRTMMGVTPEQAAQELTAVGVSVIGANCGRGIAGFAAICNRLRAATDRPIWLKANAGLPEVIAGQIRYQMSVSDFASSAAKLIDCGASFIGGCCGTTPDFIRAMCARFHTPAAAYAATQS